LKEIYIERQEKFLRIAIKENNKLKECFIEEESIGPIPGEIYKGIVKNIVPAIKCAFVDIGILEIVICILTLDLIIPR